MSSTFFESSESRFFRFQSLPVRTGHSSPHFVAVAVQPLLDCTRIISHPFDFVKMFFRIFRKFLSSAFPVWLSPFRDSSHGATSDFRFVVQSRLTPSSFCPLCPCCPCRIDGWTHGLVSLPRLSRVDFYWQSRVNRYPVFKVRCRLSRFGWLGLSPCPLPTMT